MSAGIPFYNPKEMLTLSSSAPGSPGSSILRDQTAAIEMVSVEFQPKMDTCEHGSPVTQRPPKTACQHGAGKTIKLVEPMVIPDQYLTDATVADIYTSKSPGRNGCTEYKSPPTPGA